MKVLFIMEKLNYTWEEQFNDTDELCEALVQDSFLPDVIVGISRGGLIPGVMISHKLNLPFKPVHASIRDFPHWENYLPQPGDQKVLIVDDICDSGETFERISSYIIENINHECDVRFASLWWNNECEFKPHYFIKDLAKDSEKIWINFPHEVWWESNEEESK
jgi:hypoxanthine phosphoribosyltransferase